MLLRIISMIWLSEKFCLPDISKIRQRFSRILNIIGIRVTKDSLNSLNPPKNLHYNRFYQKLLQLIKLSIT
jgi:hypothetical protein